MKPLTIELVKGQKQEFQSLGWKTPKGSDCRRHFYALHPTGKPLVVTPKPAMPEFYVPDRRAKAVFTCDPFPDAVCVEISHCRLLPPPCYQSREDWESQLPAHYVFEGWKAIYWDTHREVLLLEPSDHDPLQDRLDKWLAAMRKAYENWAGNWRDEIKRLTTAPLAELNLASEDERAKQVKEAEVQLGMYESEIPIEGLPCKGRLKLTLEDVKRGFEGIRDAWMQEDWAKKKSEDLELMAQERRRFRKWLVTHTGTPATIIDANKRVPDPSDPSKSRSTAYPGVSAPHFGEGYEQDPCFLEACASVRYRARFADNAGSVVYLADCEPPREELHATELDEVAKLRGQPVSAVVTIQQAATEFSRQIDGATKRGAATITVAGNAVQAAAQAAATALTSPVERLEALPKQINNATKAGADTLAVAGENLTKAGQQARADVEAGGSLLGARTKDLAETLGKVAEVFADPLVAAAKDSSEKQGVPPLFAWWVFQKWHHTKFPTVDGALKWCGLGPQLEKDGFGFSRPTVGRWLKIIRDELEERKLMQKRNLDRGAVKARDFDVAQASDTSPMPGDGDEPPDDFVEWAQEKHAAGAMPSEEDVLDWLWSHAGSSSLDSCSDDKLRETAKKWLKQAAKILGLDQTDPSEADEDSDP